MQHVEFREDRPLVARMHVPLVVASGMPCSLPCENSPGSSGSAYSHPSICSVMFADRQTSANGHTVQEYTVPTVLSTTPSTL